jgi:hypothetical protein
MKRGDDSGSHHAYVYQALDRLEKGVDLPLFGGDGTIALVLQCFSEEAAGVQRQGRVGVAPKVEPPLMPPLVQR